jgi:hypothetical protein
MTRNETKAPTPQALVLIACDLPEARHAIALLARAGIPAVLKEAEPQEGTYYPEVWVPATTLTTANAVLRGGVLPESVAPPREENPWQTGSEENLLISVVGLILALMQALVPSRMLVGVGTLLLNAFMIYLMLKRSDPRS